MYLSTRFGLFVLPLSALAAAGPLRAVFTSYSKQLITPVGGIRCPNQNGTDYVGAPGSRYGIECGSDHSGDDIPDIPDNPTSFPTFSDCIDHCAKQERRCMTVSFIPETGACYSKFTHGPPRDNDVYAWGARLVIKESDHGSTVTKREEEKDSEHGSDEDQEEVEAEAAPVKCYFYPSDVCRMEADGTIVEKRNSQSY
jgi:hypothetical protein